MRRSWACAPFSCSRQRCSFRSESGSASCQQSRTPGSSTIASRPLHATSCVNPSSWSVYNSEGLHFDYPSCWTAVHYSEESMFSSSLVDLSDQPTHQPCTITTSASGTTTTCGSPITRLEAGRVLVQWTETGFLGWTLDKAPGTPMTARTVATKPSPSTWRAPTRTTTTPSGPAYVDPTSIKKPPRSRECSPRQPSPTDSQPRTGTTTGRSDDPWTGSVPPIAERGSNSGRTWQQGPRSLGTLWTSR